MDDTGTDSGTDTGCSGRRQDGRPASGPERRPPTAAEAKALGHPLRLRILFACRAHARTNKELAEALGTTPGTIHYHLRQLVDQGFLRREEPRRGPRGSREQPYRTTGKSWQMGWHPEGSQALREVGAQELLAARPEDVLTVTRLGLSLPDAEVEELLARLSALAEEFAARSRTPVDAPDATPPQDAGSVTLFVSVHRPPDER